MNGRARNRLYIFFIALVALYFRLRYVLITPFEFKIDAWSMYHYALNIVKGDYYGACFGDHWARYAYWPPLYIFLSGFVYKLFGTGGDFLVMRLIHVAFSTASCFLAYLIACESIKSYSRFYREAGLAAGFLMAFNPRMVVYSNHLYAETVFITLYLLTVYWGLRYFKHTFLPELSPESRGGRIKYLILFSLFLGLSCLTRPVLLLLPGVLAVSALLSTAARRGSFRQATKALAGDGALMLVLVLLTFLPWTIRNLHVTGRFILVDTNGPINFYIAHNPLSNGQWVDVKPHTDLDRLYETGYKDGLRYLLAHGGREARLLSVKQQYYLYKTDFHETKTAAYLEEVYGLPLYRLPRLSFEFLWKLVTLLLALFAVKLIFYRAVPILFSEPAWVLGNALYVNFIILLFYFAPRYRIIAEPFLCITIGILLAGLASLERGHNLPGS